MYSFWLIVFNWRIYFNLGNQTYYIDSPFTDSSIPMSIFLGFITFNYQIKCALACLHTRVSFRQVFEFKFFHVLFKDDTAMLWSSSDCFFCIKYHNFRKWSDCGLINSFIINDSLIDFEYENMTSIHLNFHIM